ncbi:MAG: ASKHA domain-containing protein [Candidatus Hodarchaeales archaeon]
MTKIPIIKIQNSSSEVSYISNNKSILQHLLSANINPRILSLCSGKGICGKCRIQIFGSPKLNMPTDQEKKILGNLIKQNIRLACQVVPLSDLEISILSSASQSSTNPKKIHDAYLDFTLNFPFNPRIILVPIVLPDRKTRTKALEEFIIDQIKSKYGINKIEKEILQKIRDSNTEYNINLILDLEEKTVIDWKIANQPLLGLVVDLGTTTIVATLVNIVTGEILGADSILNPQIKQGRDIMSRLSYALEGEEFRKELHKEVLFGINELIQKLCDLKNLPPTNILEFVVVGNTIMHHLFNDLPVSSLAKAPYNPYIKSYITKHLRDIDSERIIESSNNCLVSCPPLIEGYIGSDAVVDILYLGLHKKKGIHLLIDFGTNSEIILVKNNKLYATSVAAGGAFEGQHISCGMRGVDGAIEHFQIVNNDYQFQIINSSIAKGVCGSGIVDIIASFLVKGLIDTRGRIFNKQGKMSKKIILQKQPEIFLTRKDIEEVQKAKGATMAGIRLLAEHVDVNLKMIDTFNIAGVFGSSLNLENAKMIGLIPNLPDTKFIIHGNIAEKGGRSFLLSMDARNEANRIVNIAEKVELAKSPKFYDYYSEELFFPKSSYSS